MIVFGLDSAGKTASAALSRDGALISEGRLATGFTHSETLLTLVDGVFRSAALTPSQVDLFAATCGPGSFTGLRIGLALVKGLAAPGGTLCAPVSTLEALAEGVDAPDGTVLAVLDARRGEVYCAAFDKSGGGCRRLFEDDARPAAALLDFAARCPKPLYLTGDGTDLCATAFAGVEGVFCLPPARRSPCGAAVCALGLRAHGEGHAVPPALLAPQYLRLSQAERERAEALASQRPGPAPQ